MSEREVRETLVTSFSSVLPIVPGGPSFGGSLERWVPVLSVRLGLKSGSVQRWTRVSGPGTLLRQTV